MLQILFTYSKLNIFYFSLARNQSIGQSANHSINSSINQAMLSSDLGLAMIYFSEASGQVAQPVLLASLKLSMAVYGDKLDGQPSA